MQTYDVNFIASYVKFIALNYYGNGAMLSYLNFDYEWPSPGSVSEHQCLELIEGNPNEYFSIIDPDITDLMSDECPVSVERSYQNVLTHYMNFWLGPDITSSFPYEFIGYFTIDIGVITKIKGFSLRNGQNVAHQDR